MSTADRLISTLRNNARIIYGLSEVIFDLAGADTGGVVGWISTPFFRVKMRKFCSKWNRKQICFYLFVNQKSSDYVARKVTNKLVYLCKNSFWFLQPNSLLRNAGFQNFDSLWFFCSVRATVRTEPTAVFIPEDALCVWTELGQHSLFLWLFVSSVKTGTRRIIRSDELSSVVRRSSPETLAKYRVRMQEKTTENTLENNVFVGKMLL